MSSSVQEGAKRVSLLDIMSEQLAEQLNVAQHPEETTEDLPEDDHAFALRLQREYEAELAGEDVSASVNEALLDEDLAFAMALQEEERRTYAGRREGDPSRAQKVTFVRQSDLADYNRPREAEYDGADDDDDANDREEALGWSMNGPGSRRHKDLTKQADGSVVSKHDTALNSRMNAVALSQLDGAGDLADEGFRVPNAVYNKLKMQLKGGTIKGVHVRGRVSKDTKATRESVLDPRTEMILFKMVQNGILAEVNGVSKQGKEASVFHASAGSEAPPALPQSAEGRQPTSVTDYAVKVFRTTLNEFSNRAEYFDGDPRFSYTKFSRQTGRKMYKLWAEKELRNLIRAYRAGLRVPQPFLQREHVLLMEFVGEEGRSAPQLREMAFSDNGWQRCYVEMVALVYMLFKCCSLVHGDLSEYNVLYHNKQLHLIDFGQAVDISHPNHLELLVRDVDAINKFFRNKGATVLPTKILVPWIVDPYHEVSLDSSLPILSLDVKLDASELEQPVIDYINEALAVVHLVESDDAEVAEDPSHLYDENTLNAWRSTQSKRVYLREFHAESDTRLDQLQALGEVCTTVERDLYHQSLQEDERRGGFWQDMWDDSRIPEENCELKHTPVGAQYQTPVSPHPHVGHAFQAAIPEVV